MAETSSLSSWDLLDGAASSDWEVLSQIGSCRWSEAGTIDDDLASVCSEAESCVSVSTRCGWPALNPDADRRTLKPCAPRGSYLDALLHGMGGLTGEKALALQTIRYRRVRPRAKPRGPAFVPEAFDDSPDLDEEWWSGKGYRNVLKQRQRRFNRGSRLEPIAEYEYGASAFGDSFDDATDGDESDA